MRTLQCGDFVWGLYHKGCAWYPALIEEINIETKEVRLKYLLTTDEVKKFQSLTISRQFLPRSGLTVSSHSMQHTGEKKEKMKAGGSPLSLPQSIQSEKDICGFVFDQIVSVCAETAANDENSPLTHTASSMDYVHCQYLIDSLKEGPEYRQLIRTSAWLTALFHPTHSLSDHLVAMFCRGNDDDDQSAGLISKTEFIEFCDIAKDIFVYQIQ
jgi:hypothetical protein